MPSPDRQATPAACTLELIVSANEHSEFVNVILRTDEGPPRWHNRR